MRGPLPAWREFATRWRILPILSALGFVFMTVDAARIETPTVDEFAHVPAGAAYWKHGALDLYSKNPPLLKLALAAPIAIDPDVTVPPPAGDSLGWGPWVYGTRFMDANRDHYLDLFFRARLIPILLALATALLLYRWSRDLFGEFAAAITTTLFLLSPTVIAHAHLATLDVGSMWSIFLSVYALRWCQARPSWQRLVACGAALGLALSIKFTAVLIVPVLAGLVLVHRAGFTRRAAADLAIILVVALVLVNAVMGFQGSLRSLGSFEFSSTSMQLVTALLPDDLPVPLPEDYLVGFDAQRLDTETGEFPSYLMGGWSSGGWWAYNLVALAVKVPAPLLLLFLAAPWGWRRSPVASREAWAVVLPVVVLFLALSLLNRLNIGIRYLLPILPFLFLASAAVWARTRSKLLPLALCGYLTVVAVVNHPAHLGFFNLLAGGPSRGSEWLLDSNLDWGQDLYRVAEIARELDEEETLRVLYFGHVDPMLYGIRYRLVPPWPVRGVLAVSVNFLKGATYVATAPAGRMQPVERGHLDWLSAHEPVAKLGSIWVFDTRTAALEGAP